MERVNPLRVLREATGLSITRLAREAGISEQAIMRNEQGVYATPSALLLDTLWDLAPESDLHDYGIFMADYYDFQKSKRRHHYGDLDPTFDPKGQAPVEVRDSKGQVPVGAHPFVRWRHESDMSRVGVSTAYCVHPALVFKFEKQPWLCATPPKELLRALSDAGYDNDLLASLSQAYTAYKDSRKITSE